MNYLLNRRLFLKLLGLVPVLKKVLEPAPEVVQPMERSPYHKLLFNPGHCEKTNPKSVQFARIVQRTADVERLYGLNPWTLRK